MNRRNAHRVVRSSLLPVGLCGATVNPRFGPSNSRISLVTDEARSSARRPDDRGKDTSMRATGYQDD
jgi:hypothetical protein